MSAPVLFSLFVPGVPQPAGSKKGFVVRSKATGKLRAIITDDAKQSRPWKDRITALAVDVWRGTPLDEPLELACIFTMPRPASHYGSRKGMRYLKPTAPHFHTHAPDATKLLRACEDALNGAVWKDDSRVVVQLVRKVYGERAGVWIRVRRATAPSETEHAPASLPA